jgi:hypothetical protein
MAQIISLQTNSPPVPRLLNEQDKNLVALLSNALVTQTIKLYEEGHRLPQVQQGRSEQQQHRTAGDDQLRLVPA